MHTCKTFDILSSKRPQPILPYTGLALILLSHYPISKKFWPSIVHFRLQKIIGQKWNNDYQTWLMDQTKFFGQELLLNFIISIAGHRHRSRWRPVIGFPASIISVQYRTGFLYYGTELAPASAFIFIPVPDWLNARQSGIPLLQCNNLYKERYLNMDK